MHGAGGESRGPFARVMLLGKKTQISHTLTKKHKHTHIRVPKGGTELCVLIKCAYLSALMQPNKDPASRPCWLKLSSSAT